LIDENFHARKYPDHAWRKTSSGRHIEAVYQLHRLREVMALIGFTRLKPVTPDINGEYDKDVSRADLAEDPSWFPAVENRGEGIFLQLNSDEVSEWSQREAVRGRLTALQQGHAMWAKERESKREFPGGAFVLLHTFSHLFIQSLSMRCGYPISSIRERIYVDTDNARYGVLFYTSSTDASGTLGGLVQQARYVEDHLRYALQLGSLCSNDPICAHHSPNDNLEQRYLHGAACHGCTLISETSCEYHNDYLDRALVVPTLSQPGSAFFARTI
jgi:energy-converting hydrogenase Eha subunit F